MVLLKRLSALQREDSGRTPTCQKELRLERSPQRERCPWRILGGGGHLGALNKAALQRGPPHAAKQRVPRYGPYG